MFDVIFLDLDDTLLDFHRAEAIAVAKALRSVGAPADEDVIRRYSQINRQHWQMLEKGLLTREEVLLQRFSCLFKELGISADSAACRDHYEDFLCIGHYFIDGAQEVLEALSRRYRLYLASNGTTKVQEARLKSAGITHYFQRIFLSQQLGVDKPSPEFFCRCAAQIPNYQPERALIVGDSLTSDIQGGRNAGIRTCWFQPSGALPPVPVDYTVRTLRQLLWFL